MSRGSISVNGRLFFKAKEAVERSKSDRDEVLVAVVFSAMWFESFVNQSVERLDWRYPDLRELPKRLRTLVRAFRELDERTSVTRKLRLMSLLLTDEPLSAGSTPFQDFFLLQNLRNNLVHLRLGRTMFDTDGEPSLQTATNLTAAFKARGMLSDEGQAIGLGWMDAIDNPDVAEWAFDTSVNTALAVAAFFPKGRFREEVEADVFGSPANERRVKRSKLVPRSSPPLNRKI